jgi:hypothetical protein
VSSSRVSGIHGVHIATLIGFGAHQFNPLHQASKMKTEIAKTTSHQYLRIIVSFREKSRKKIHEKRGFKAGERRFTKR